MVVMPAYNAGRTLRLTYEDRPKNIISITEVNVALVVSSNARSPAIPGSRRIAIKK